jgi:hypothetical protein
MKRSAMPRKRATPRRTTSPRCSNRQCSKPARIEEWCTTHAQREADRLFSLFVRERDNGCTFYSLDAERRPHGGPLQAAHGEPRGNHATRYDERNVHAVCRDHHMLLDRGSKHALKAAWLTSILGTEGYLDLVDDALVPASKYVAIAEALQRLRVSA